MNFIKMTKKGNAVVAEGDSERKAYFVPGGLLISPSLCGRCVFEKSGNVCREAVCTPKARELEGLKAEDGHYSWDKP